MASSEYWSQSARRDRRYESPDVIHQQRELKRRVYILKANRRLAIRCASYGTWLPWHTYDLVRRFGNGALDTEVDQLTSKAECDGTHLARSASATGHTLHAMWTKVAM